LRRREDEKAAHGLHHASWHACELGRIRPSTIAALASSPWTSLDDAERNQSRVLTASFPSTCSHQLNEDKPFPIARLLPVLAPSCLPPRHPRQQLSGMVLIDGVKFACQSCIKGTRILVLSSKSEKLVANARSERSPVFQGTSSYATEGSQNSPSAL
jgi:hypothetical protein